MVKELTGAQVMRWPKIVPALQIKHGGQGANRLIGSFTHDRRFGTIGDTTLVAHLTRVHARLHHWTMKTKEDGRPYERCLPCSLRTAGSS